MTFRENQIFRFFGLLRRAFGQYKRQIAVIAALNFLSGILEGVGINAVIPLFSFINGRVGEIDAISRAIESFFRYFGFQYSVRTVLIFIIVLFLAKAVVSFAVRIISTHITSDYEEKTRQKLFQKMLESDWRFLLKQKVGYLDQILITDMKSGSAFLAHVATLLLVVANLAVYGIITVNVSPIIALLALTVGAVVFIFFKPLFYRNRMASTRIAHQLKELAHFINENVIGMKTVKTMAVELPVFDRGSGFFSELRRLRLKVEFLKATTDALLQPLGLLFIIGIFAFFYKVAGFNFASFAVIVYAVNRVFGNIQLVQSELHVLSAHAPHLLSVLNYLEDADAHHERAEFGSRLFHFSDRIAFQKVSFSYNSNHAALSDVSFFVRKGEMVGLIGPSGSGKTTVVDLLLRLLAPLAGVITVDGEDIIKIAVASWRKNVGYVSQDTFLMNDTIENNIRFYDETISTDDVMNAARLANIAEFIRAQPDGLKAMVGERGIALSGGQRQRIALARVLTRRSPILILDEATSALDNESEILIQAAIEKLRGKITVIAIAHRLSTIANSDRIIVLEGGRIVEQGTPQELLGNKESYFFKTYHLRK